MSTSRIAISAAALAAASFGVGFVSGSRAARGGLDLDLARSRVREAVAAPDRLEQTALLLPTLEAMDPTNAAALAQVFEDGFATGGGGLPLELFVESWARFDPQACRARLENWPPDYQRQAWPALMRAWALRDPEAAAATLQGLPDASMRWLGLTALIDGWSESGRPGLWNHLSQLPDRARRRELAAPAVANRLRRTDTDVLLREFDSIAGLAAGDSFRGELLLAVVEALAREDLARAVALVEAQRDRSWHPEMMRILALQWVSTDAAGALDWLRAQPAGSPRDSAMRYAYRRWFRSDPPRAESWIAERISEADFAPAVLSHAAALAFEEPERARAWVQRIADPGLRERSVRQIEAMEQLHRRAGALPPPTAPAETAPQPAEQGPRDPS